ncbi:hypothetical protein K0H71_19260 [Bacillus sp. IITD106]|nr:hypothetical protein [Bacillus sp. IITD106]
MKRNYFLLLFFISFILSLGFHPSLANACSCAEIPSVEDELERSKVVFIGKVLSIKQIKNSNGYAPYSVLFDVSSVWKGPKHSEITILTGLGGGDCGFEFKEGEEYLVYANESTMYGPDSLVTTICNRTNILSSSHGDLEKLGEDLPPNGKTEINESSSPNESGIGDKPYENADSTEKQEGNYLLIWGITLLILVIAFAFIIKKYKGKRGG